MQYQEEYLAESLLINHLLINSKTSLLDNKYLIKEAGVEDLLGGVAGYLKDWAKDHIDTSSPGAIVKSLGLIMVPSVLFRINPILGIIYTIAQEFGFDIGSVISGIYSFIADKISSGQTVSSEDITAKGKELTAAQAGPMTSEASFFNMLYSETLFVKNAVSGGTMGSISGAALFPSAGSSLIQRIFGNLFSKGAAGQGKAKWLLGGFAVWIIKTLIGGAGLMAGVGAIHNLISSGPKQESSQTAGTTSEKTPERQNITPNNSKEVINHNLKSSGDGEQYHKNSSGSIWIVPTNNVSQTLIDWAINIYPELSGNEDKIEASHNFHSMVNKLKQETKNGKLVVPQEFHTRKQIVDKFVGNL